MSRKRFKGITSISDGSFDEFLKLDSSGVSKYTMEEIKAKSAVLGLTDELTTQAVALAKDADFTAKAATGKLTWGKAIATAGDNIDEVGNALLKSGKLSDNAKQNLQAILDSGKVENYKQGIMDAINSVDGLSDSIIDLGSTGKEAGSSLSNIFKGLVATFVKLLPLITAVGAAFVAYKLYDWATLSYSEARDNLDSSTLSYQQTKDELESLNSELETTTSRIEELRELQANGSITIVEEAELEKLERENASLERQIEIKQKLAEIQAQEQINAAKTVLDYKSETINDTDSTGFVKTDFTGGIKTKQVDRFEWVQEQMKFYTQAKENVVSAEKALVEATSRYDAGEISKKQLGQYETNLKNNENAVTEYEEAISSKLAEIGADIEGLYVNGKLSEEGEVYVRQFNELSDAFNNIDLSPAEKKLKSIESFFDGSKSRNVLKDELIKIAKSGNITEDSLASLSLTLEDLGLSGSDGLSTLNRYFKDLTKSIDTASDAVEGFDGSLESITKAGESENQDNNWNVTAALFKKAKGLDDSKKWGTDDFQSMAQFIAPEGSIINTKNSYLKATDYKDLWDKYYSNFKKYFDEDNPLQSAINAQDKLISSGLGTMGKDGIVRWTKEFKSSSDAAKAWGISVEAAEIAMHNLESYGAEFDGINFDGEELDKYKNSLEGIRSIYESLDDGSQKDRLGELLKSFDEQYAVFEGDLSELKEDQIVKIKFEYDLASIQQKIEELKDLAFATGSNEDWAAVTVSQKQERELLENKTGYTKASDEGYSASYDKITSLRENMKGKAEEERAAINTEIAAIQELQNAFQIFKLDGGQLDWNSYIQSDKATKALNEIKEATGLTREQIAELFGLKPEDMKFDVEADTTDAENKIKGVLSNDGTTITMNVDASTEEINNQLNSLQEGQRLLFNAEIDDKGIQAIEAVKRQDGSIVYTAIDNGVQYYLQEVKHEDGTITYTLGEVPTEVPPADQEVYRNPNNEEVLNPAPSTTQTVKRKPDNTEIDKNPPNIFQKVIRYVTGNNLSIVSASGTITPALASGTAYNVINPKPLSAFAKGDISLPQDEVALVNELGTEGLIRDGKLMAIPGGMHMQALRKGDIILSVEQMKALYATGKASGHARAYANGTILSSAYGNAMPSLGGSYGKSYGNSSTPKTTTSKTKSSTEDALDAISNYFDWVKVRFDRLARETEIAEDAIENAIGLQAKQSATSKAIAKVKAEMDVARQGYNTYLAHANKVASELGLSSDLQKKVQNGTIDITQYDEDTKKKIEEYQSAYEDALDALDKVRELQDKERELAQQRLENVEEFYGYINDIAEAMKGANDAKLEYDFAKGYSSVSDSVRKVYEDSLEQTKEIYENNLKQLEEYQSEFHSLMDQGYIQKGSDAYYKAVAKIYEFNEAISKAGTAIIEFEDKIRDIEYTKIQYIIDGFERAVDKLDAQISLMKARNEKVPESIYQKQIDSNNQRIQANKDMRDAKLAEQAYYDVDSERYQEIADEINKLDIETLGLMEDNEKLKDSIYELRFEALDEGIEKSRALRDEINDIRSLMNEDSFFDKDGKITESGLTNIALLEQGIAAAKKEIADYRVGLEKLQESYDNGVISETEYNEKSEEYRKGIRESVKDVQDYTESLTDLYITQMSKENESLKKSIQLRIKALEAKESYYEYDKKIRSQSKDVNALRSEIAALEGVNNSQAKARLKQLKQQLADAEDTLNETKRSHSVEVQKDGYSEMMSNLDENLENLEYEISHNADKQQEVIQSMLNSVVNMYETAYGKINQIISNTGLTVSEGFEQNQSQLSTQSGAESQMVQATQPQSNVQANSSASSTVTKPINSNDSTNKQIEAEITTDPNTDNRLCAELTVNISSVTLEEGKSVSVSTSIRPSDAKNKTLAWDSSNTSIATVSVGTIKAVKPGTCQIIVSTTDGSGLSQTIGVTVTKKPEPPKQQNSSSQTNGGDGVPKVGDMVTFASGSYYYDSEGVKPVGSQHQGQKVYITKINTASWATKPYHISTGSKLGSGDLGWVTLNQIKGYVRGSKHINGKRWALTQEKGQELIARLSDGSLLTPLGNGDKVFTKEQTDKLWEMSKGLDSKFINLNTSNVIGSLPNIVNRNEMSQKTEVNLNFDTLMTIEGNVCKDAIPGLQKEIDKMIPHISDKLAIYIKGDLRKL